MINRNNVKELWELYEDYKADFYKNYYSDVKCEDFENYINNNVKQCNACKDYYLDEEMGKSEFALENNICQYCMQNGY